MKKIVISIALSLTIGCLSASAAVLAGWENWTTGTTPASLENGATGSAVNSGFSLSSVTAARSIDGTFGTLLSPAASTLNTLVSHGYQLSNGADGSVDFTITDTSGFATNLEFVHFDYTRARNGSAENWSLDVLAGSAISVGNVSSGTFAINNTDTGDLDDNDISLAGLADFKLDAFASVTFRLAFTGGNSGAGQHSYFDNVALSGSAIALPEPSTLGLLGIGGLLLAGARRRFAR